MTPLPAQQMSDVERELSWLDAQPVYSIAHNCAETIREQRAELERLRAEREGLRKRIERVEQLIGLTLNTIPKDCGGICTCNRCEIMREVQAALAATHADEAKGESHAQG